jgi:hypothetical protein
MHGGLSTGPRTLEGLERSRRARWKHGYFSREATEARRIANCETWEDAQVRLRREANRMERVADRSARELTRAMRRLLGGP